MTPDLIIKFQLCDDVINTVMTSHGNRTVIHSHKHPIGIQKAADIELVLDILNFLEGCHLAGVTHHGISLTGLLVATFHIRMTIQAQNWKTILRQGKLMTLQIRLLTHVQHL